jgi:hypothetical protein
MDRQYDARETVGVEQGMAAEAAYRRSKMSWEEMSLEGMDRNIAKLKELLAKAKKAAERVPIIEMEIERAKQSRERFAADYIK